MYMALTEEQAWEIRKLGITVIEWKWCVKENVNVFIYIRYKFVKILGAMGYDKQRVWTLTRHTWLARSNC